MSRSFVFDIETGPLPADQLPPFDESTVKLGALKDPVKIKAKIEEARAAYVERAALDATTGRVLAIGYDTNGNFEIEGSVIAGGNISMEEEILTEFWDRCDNTHLDSDNKIIGFNIHGFDLPFMIRRSWINNIEPPRWLMRGRYFDPMFVDLMQVWACGDSRGYQSMDRVATALGTTRKNGDGAEFHKLWFGDKKQHKLAVEYLQNDIAMTRDIASRLGVL